MALASPARIPAEAIKAAAEDARLFEPIPETTTFLFPYPRTALMSA